LVESHKLDPWPLDEGPRPKSGKSKPNLHGTIFLRISIGWVQKNSAKGEFMIWRIKMQAKRKPKENTP